MDQLDIFTPVQEISLSCFVDHCNSRMHDLSEDMRVMVAEGNYDLDDFERLSQEFQRCLSVVGLVSAL